MTAVHQFLPSFAARDAIGAHVLHLRALLRGAGFESEIYAAEIKKEMREQARPYGEYRRDSKGRGSKDWLLYHASTGSPMADFLMALDNRLIVYYHNITEARFFDRWAPDAAASVRSARMELRRLGPVTTLGIANSRFSEAELVDAGFSRTAVVPVMVDLADYDTAPPARALPRLKKGAAAAGAHWLFVGRIAPNKCQHDVVAAFAVYRRLFDPEARLTLVGGRTSHAYWRALETQVADLGLAGAVEMADTIPFPTLLAHYRAASVFVCLSEHEGFCVPLLEAMHFGVPIVAFESSAVGETVGDAGLLLPDKDPLLVAAAVGRIMSDERLRDSLRAAGDARVKEFALPATGRLMLDTLNTVLMAGAEVPAAAGEGRVG